MKQGQMSLSEVQENMSFQDVLLSTQKIQTNSEMTDRLPSVFESAKLSEV